MLCRQRRRGHLRQRRAFLMRKQGRCVEPSRLRLELPVGMEHRPDEGPSEGSGCRVPLHARIELLLSVAAVQPGPFAQDQEARTANEKGRQGQRLRRWKRGCTESLTMLVYKAIYKFLPD